MRELLIGQIPEAIYFALFLILVKQLKEKKLLFTVLLTIDYVLLLCLFPYSIWSHILFFVCTYCLLKILYKEYSQITDIFTLAIASIVMIAINAVLYFVIQLFTNSYMIYVIIERIILFILLFIFRNYFSNLQNLYKKFWNRNDKIKKKIKSTTFRSFNLVLFNIMFYIIHIGMAYLVLTYRIGGA